MPHDELLLDKHFHYINHLTLSDYTSELRAKKCHYYSTLAWFHLNKTLSFKLSKVDGKIGFLIHPLMSSKPAVPLISPVALPRTDTSLVRGRPTTNLSRERSRPLSVKTSTYQTRWLPAQTSVQM